MYKYQSTLPRFPVPKLEDTLEKYKEVSYPLLSEKEWNDLCRIVDEFKRTDGPHLQNLLLELEKESPYNWMEGYWESMYLDLRCPLPINVNPFVLFADDPDPIRHSSQVLRAASIVEAAAEVFLKIQKEDFEPEKIGDVPLCMNGFTQVAGTRIPKLTRDEYFVAKNATHMTVVCHNIPYRLEVIKDGAPIPETEIARHLQAIIEHAKQFEHTPESVYFVGKLTTENRNTWAVARSKLMDISQQNRNNLSDIESSLLVVCLDDFAPTDLTDFSKHSLMSPTNRYYDKLEVIITKDGKVGWNMEHTAYDGQVLGRVILDIYHIATSKPSKHVNFSSLPRPSPLFFFTTSDIQSSIKQAEGHWNEFIASTDLTALIFDKYGKNEIKKFNIPPDAYFQAAAQLATKRTYGRCVPTYESSSVRNYQHGRTETIRPLTRNLKNFIDLFETPGVEDSKKYEALQLAAKAHQAFAKASKTGGGIDRHLQCLNWTSLQKSWRIYQFKIPQLFTHPTYQNFMSNMLSTSNLGGDLKGMQLFGFGAVTAEGVGLGYLVNTDSIFTCTTSYTRRSQLWTDNMASSLIDIWNMCNKVTNNN